MKRLWSKAATLNRDIAAQALTHIDDTIWREKRESDLKALDARLAALPDLN